MEVILCDRREITVCCILGPWAWNTQANQNDVSLQCSGFYFCYLISCSSSALSTRRELGFLMYDFKVAT